MKLNLQDMFIVRMIIDELVSELLRNINVFSVTIA